jgi:uncharacterized protein
LSLVKRFVLLNNCLFKKNPRICIASDLHMGLENELNNQGLAFPLQENKILIERLDEVLDRFSPDTFVLAGDIMHSFNWLDPNVKEKLELLLVRIRKRCNPVILRAVRTIQCYH